MFKPLSPGRNIFGKNNRGRSSKIKSNLQSFTGRTLSIEALEDRRMLAAFTVSSLADAGAGSLREAISMADANSEPDTIDFSVTGTINIASQLPTIDDDLTITGPGANSLAIDAGDGTNNVPSDGDGYRIFRIISGPASPIVTLTGMTLTGGDTSTFNDGGAILSTAQLVLSDMTIDGNASGRNGGGIFVQVAGTGTSREDFKIENSIIQNNVSLSGGGIYTKQHNGSSALVSSVTFLDNEASLQGGGLYTDMDSSTTTFNVLSSTFESNDANEGAGLYADVFQANLQIDQSTFDANEAISHGGAAYLRVRSSTTAITDSLLQNNVAGENGGGLYALVNSSSGLLDVFSSTFELNEAENGAGLYADVSQANLQIDQSTFDANVATSQGGGVHIELTFVSTATIIDTLLQNNVAGGNGGGVFGDIDHFFSSLSIIDSRLKENEGADGGGVSLELSSASSASISNSDFEQNNASGSGGAIHAITNETSSLVIEDSVVTGNEAIRDGGGIFTYSNANTSAPFISPRAVTISRSLISGNLTQRRGGGLYTRNFNGTETLVEDSRITGNIVDSGTAGNGGGIYSYLQDDSGGTNKPRFIISQSTVDNNDARYEGGGIFVCGKFFADFTAVNSTITGNETLDMTNGGGGGGILIARFGSQAAQNESIDAYLRNVTVTQNTSADGGGVLSSDLDNVRTTITNSIISENFDHQQQPNNLDGRVNIATTKFNLVGSGSTILDLNGDGDPGILNATNLNATDLTLNDAPELFPLANNGGLTLTHRPMLTSPAVDAGDPSAVAGVDPIPDYDQRGEGFPRVFDGNDDTIDQIDIGAYEIGLAKVIDVTIVGPNALDGNLPNDGTEGRYSIPSGSGAQLVTVPIGGADEIEIRFSEEVDATTLSNSLSLIGAASATDYSDDIEYQSYVPRYNRILWMR